MPSKFGAGFIRIAAQARNPRGICREEQMNCTPSLHLCIAFIRMLTSDSKCLGHEQLSALLPALNMSRGPVTPLWFLALHVRLSSSCRSCLLINDKTSCVTYKQRPASATSILGWRRGILLASYIYGLERRGLHARTRNLSRDMISLVVLIVPSLVSAGPRPLFRSSGRKDSMCSKLRSLPGESPCTSCVGRGKCTGLRSSQQFAHRASELAWADEVTAECVNGRSENAASQIPHECRDISARSCELDHIAQPLITNANRQGRCSRRAFATSISASHNSRPSGGSMPSMKIASPRGAPASVASNASKQRLSERWQGPPLTTPTQAFGPISSCISAAIGSPAAGRGWPKLTAHMLSDKSFAAPGPVKMIRKTPLNQCKARL